MIITMITIWEVPVYEHTRLSLYKATHSKYEITSKTSHTKKNIFKYHFNCKRWPTRCNYFWLIYLFLISPACFGRCLRPSSGALDCIYSFWYCPPILLPAGIMDEMELQFHLIHDTSRQRFRWTISESVNTGQMLLMMDEDIARNM